MTFWDNKRVLVTGGAGFLGSFVVEKILEKGVHKEDILVPRSNDIDLRERENCIRSVENIDIVIHMAAKVGGIGYNQAYPASLFYDNAIMGLQMMEAARQEGVKKFVAIGTVCAYPKFTPVPFREEELWNGYPEETNAPYGLAKKMMLVQSSTYRQQYEFNSIFLLPVNLYGPRDNFNLESSHVIPALIRKFTNAIMHNEKEVKVWGTGQASREFLYVEDAAMGIVLATERYEKADPVNIGAGFELKISDLVDLVAELTGFNGEVRWDASKPDGQLRRRLDTSKAKKEFGFEAKTALREGLIKTIDWYKNLVMEDSLK
ncbi:GDP-L-fucose synthase family protein [Chloroflexota bacterium]